MKCSLAAEFMTGVLFGLEVVRCGVSECMLRARVQDVVTNHFEAHSKVLG